VDLIVVHEVAWVAECAGIEREGRIYWEDIAVIGVIFVTDFKTDRCVGEFVSLNISEVTSRHIDSGGPIREVG
jgi:hypothetical protein